MRTTRLLAWAALVGAQWTYPVPQAPTSPPELSNATTTGMTVTWEPTIESESYAVDAYRVEVLSLQERHKGWQVLDDAVEEARTRNEVQFINVRVDRGSRVSGGGFWLYLAYDGIHPIDTDHKQAVTPEIPWDASAAQMKSALEALDTVNVVQVRRCDAAFLPNKPGAEAWVGRCPFGHLGGYTWVVEFERPRTEKDHNWFLGTDRKVAEDGWNERLQKDVKSAQEAGRMPLLSVWKETISLRDGYKWSGPGAGIEVWRASNYQPCGSTLHELNLGHDFDAPMPPPSLCTYRAENLKRPGGLYAFRISAHNAAGWSAPSQPSSYRRLDAVEPPPRPIAPVWAVPSDARFRQGSATLYASRPDQTESEFAAPAAAFDVQYKYEGDDTWLDGGRVTADESGWAARTIDDLDVERKVVARVRARNAAGLSAWSGASPPGHVTRDARPPPPSKPALELDGDEMQVRWLPAVPRQRPLMTSTGSRRRRSGGDREITRDIRAGNGNDERAALLPRNAGLARPRLFHAGPVGACGQRDKHRGDAAERRGPDGDVSGGWHVSVATTGQGVLRHGHDHHGFAQREPGGRRRAGAGRARCCVARQRVRAVTIPGQVARPLQGPRCHRW